MNYEEKYKEALGKTNWYKEGFTDGKYSGRTSKEWTINDAATLKELIDFLENGTVKLQHDLTRYANWLKIQFTPIEKQGEKKPYKVERKFKVGDFIINDYCFGKVIELTDDAYLLDTEQGIPFSCEHNARLWTIEDAKPGDILSCKDNIVIFKSNNYNPETQLGCMCVYFLLNERYCYWGELDGIIPTDFHPACSEERNKLFDIMKAAGYEWNAKKKELMKI